MKVWIVAGNYNTMSQDGEYIEAIYATPELAEAAMAELRADADDDDWPSYRVYWEEVLS